MKFVAMIEILFLFCCTQNKMSVSKRVPTSLLSVTLDKGAVSNNVASNNESKNQMAKGNVISSDRMPYAMDEIDVKLSESYRSNNFSAFSLDDQPMTVYQAVVGLQQLIEKQTPFVSYLRPKVADYVEILRCTKNVYIETANISLSWSDLEVSEINSDEKARLFLSEDIFSAAQSDQKNCELITDGTQSEEFPDPWAPSGSFIYLLRACVSPLRLIDTDKLTTRNCSKRVAFTNTILDYINERSEKEKELMRNSSVHESAIDGLALKIKDLSNNWVKETEICEKREHDRAVNTNRKKAIIAIVAAGLDLALELKTSSKSVAESGGRMRHYAKPAGWMDFMQLMSVGSGMSFGQIFNEMLTSPADMPRSCSESIKIDQEIVQALQALLTEGMLYSNNLFDIQINKNGEKADAGISVDTGNTGLSGDTGSSGAPDDTGVSADSSGE